MKKYFGVIASLVATSSLATMVACGSKKSSPVVKSSILQEIKNKFDNNVTSSKIKSQIGLGKKRTEITDLATIGYSTPKGIPADVVVKYTLKDKSNGETDEMFEITVVITQGTETVTKDIKITASFDWSNLKSLIKDVSSTKRKGEIILPNDDAVDKTIIPTNIGFTSHDVSSIPGVSIEKYELKSKGGIDTDGDTYKFKATVHLKKDTGKATQKTTKDFFIAAKSYNGNKAKELLVGAHSNKIKSKITFPDDKNSGSQNFDNIGYDLPNLLSLGASVDKYTLIKGWETDSDGRHQFQIRLHLKGGNGTTPEITTKDIWIKAYDFTFAKDQVKDAKSSVSKSAIEKVLRGKSVGSIITPTEMTSMGYTPPTLLNGVAIKKYEGKSDGQTTDTTTNMNKIKVAVTLEKKVTNTKTLTDTKDIGIETYDFTAVKDQVKDAKAFISKSAMEEVLRGKSVGSIITDTEMTSMGYTPPTLLNGVAIKKYEGKSDGQTTDTTPNMNKIKVAVTLEKKVTDTKTLTDTKDIGIETYDFTAVKDQIEDTQTSKSKRDIEEVLRGKSVGSIITYTEMTRMGYKPPELLALFEVAIKKYEGKSDGQTTDTTTNINMIQVTVTLQKTLNAIVLTDTKDIWVKAYDFTAIKDQIEDTQPYKSKRDIEEILRGKSVGHTITPTEMTSMGYTPPTLVDGAIIKEYKGKSNGQTTDTTTNINMIQVTVTLQKTLNAIVLTDTKDIWVKAYDFTAVKNQIEDTQSSKSKRDIEEILRGKSVGHTITPTEMTSMGYTPPTLLNGVTIKKYEGKSDGQTTDTTTNMNKIKVTVILEKEVNSATNPTNTKDIWIKAYDFTTAIQQIQDAESSISKSEIGFQIPKMTEEFKLSNPIIFTPSEMTSMGYTPPLLVNGVKIKEYKLIKSGGVDSDSYKFEIEAHLQKGKSRETKIFGITAKKYDFTKALEKLQNAVSTTKKSHIIEVKFFDGDKNIFPNGIGGTEPTFGEEVKVKKIEFVDKKGFGPESSTLKVKVTLERGIKTAIETAIETKDIDIEFKVQ